MAEAARDQNRIPTLLGVSSADGITPVAVYVDPTTHRMYVDIPGGSGTVTTVSVVSANGFAGTVANASSTPAITLTTSINAPVLAGNGTAISAATTTGSGSTVALATSPVFTTPTLGVASATSLATSAATPLLLTNGQLVNVALTAQTVGATTLTIPDFAGVADEFVFKTKSVTMSNKTFVAPVLGAATATSINGLTITSSTGTFTLTNAKTLSVTNSLTLSGTDGTTMTFPTTSATIARTDAANAFTGVQTMTSPSITTSIVTGSGSFDAFNTTATTLNFGGAATTLTIGGTPTTAITHNYSTNATAAATTKTVNLGTGGAASSTTNVNIGATPGGTTTINSPTISLGSTTGATTTGTIELGHASDTTLSRSAAGVLAVEGVVIPSISSTNTLTNKRVTRRLTTTNGPGATPTTNTDNVDIMNFTGLGTAITSMTTNLSGTPSDGDLIEFRFLDDGTARAITWGASFAATTVALPTTTVISTCLRVGFEWRSSSSKWECVATC